LTIKVLQPRNRLDYILLSPELADVATGGGIFRKGLWGTASRRGER
jgi:hypothetical protein